MRCAVGGIDVGACPVIVLQFLQVGDVGIPDGRAVIEELRLRAFVKVEDEGGVRGGKGDFLGVYPYTTRTKSEC
jgi:hypothetical protein